MLALAVTALVLAATPPTGPATPVTRLAPVAPASGPSDGWTDEPTSPPPPSSRKPEPRPAELTPPDDRLQTAMRLRRWGMICTGIGVGLGVLGGAVATISVYGFLWSEMDRLWVVPMSAAGTVYMIGQIGILGGIAMWVYGSLWADRIEARRGRVMGAWASPVPGGAVVGVSGAF